jgi:hypothetical protein
VEPEEATLEDRAAEPQSELSELESNTCDEEVQLSASGEEEVQPGMHPPPPLHLAFSFNTDVPSIRLKKK